MDVKNPKPKGSSYLGKLRAMNSKRNEYHLYDSGENPAKLKPHQEPRKAFFLAQFTDETIKEIGNVKTTKLFIPRWKDDSAPYIGFDDPYELGFSKDVHTIINKPPKWNKKQKKYVYNFGGRVQEASNKNTQLIVDTYSNKLVNQSDTEADGRDALLKENIVFQFGQYDKTIFNLDFQGPLSIFQAF